MCFSSSCVTVESPPLSELDLSGTGVGIDRVLVLRLGGVRLEPSVRKAFSRVFCNCSFFHACQQICWHCHDKRLPLKKMIYYFICEV